VDKPETVSDEVPEKIVRLAIGVEGGFKGDVKVTVIENFFHFVIENKILWCRAFPRIQQAKK
jgi:hypothetical protein